MDQHDSTSLLMTLAHHREGAGAGGEAPPTEERRHDRPEMVDSFDSEWVEREDASREITRLGILPVTGDGGQFTPLAGAEPVPGYRLVQRVGSGGSGEVWRAIGPGGFPVALKFVRMIEGVRGIETSSPQSLRSARDTNLRSLELIREIRHPNLLTMFGAWERDGLLIIGMELADRTLMDRLDEAIGAGLPGIPLAELLAMMRQAARGVDHLNTPGLLEADHAGAGIQHRDVKPQNLLLVGDVVKLGDFGLAKLRDEQVSKTGSLTATYAAPELFQGKVSGRSDQYSLAVTFCQLRGGALPFGGSLYEVMMGHHMGTPDLTMLPEAERPAVARGLAKDPADRWPDCQSLVEAIAAGVDPGRRRAVGRRGRGVAALAGALAAASVVYLAYSSIGLDRHHAARPPGPAAAVTVAAPVAESRARRPADAAPASHPEPGPDAPRDHAVAPANTIVVTAPEPGPGPLRLVEIGAIATGAKERATTGIAALAKAASRLAELRHLKPRPDASRDHAVASASLADVKAPAPEPDPPRPPEVVAAPRPAEATGRESSPPTPAVRPSPPRVATIEVLMPSATAELAVRGAVGKGQPDEWYGPRRVIHTPPLAEGADYLVGAFWRDPSGAPSTRNCRLNVKPGLTYEVDLRPTQPTSRTVAGETPPLPLPQGNPNEDLRYRPDPGGPVVRK